jgi:nitrite reductase/ring-hydroxylating ferredoxin subunit
MRDLQSLVDVESGFVSREIFDAPDLYRREQEQIFGRCWLYLGHESQAPAPGDYFTTYMGEAPVVVTRDGEGQIHAFLNSCRHRGRRVCQTDSGHTSSFRCPYHGWTYNSAGQLTGVPHYAAGYDSRLDRDAWGLHAVARLENYKGLLWATWDPAAPSFADYLGDYRFYLDLLVDRSEDGLELIGGVQRWTIAANWKFFVENNTPDLYHVPFTHASNIADGGLTRPYGRNELAYTICTGKGHSLGGQIGGLSGGDELPTEYYDYLKQVRERLAEQRGPSVAQVVPTGVGVIFPNFCFLDSQRIRTFRLAQPRGPHCMELHSWVVVDKALPEHLKRDIRRQYVMINGPGGVFEQDDVDNWTHCDESTRWPVGRHLPFNYQLGAGHDQPASEVLGPGLPGTVAMGYTESALRGFYQRWLAVMTATTWQAL